MAKALMVVLLVSLAVVFVLIPRSHDCWAVVLLAVIGLLTLWGWGW